jgi:hypothetical protein
MRFTACSGIAANVPRVLRNKHYLDAFRSDGPIVQDNANVHVPLQIAASVPLLPPNMFWLSKT